MIIVSGPSTIGKNPFIYQACQIYDLNYIIPYTTRDIRSDEKAGKDYFFLSKEEFQTKIREKEICEWDYCLNNYYGYSFAFPGSGGSITHGLARMALRIKGKYPQNITIIFLMPSNKDIIFKNLKNIYSGKDLLLREALVEEEIWHSNLFDKVFTVSDSALELFYEKEIKNILLAEKNEFFLEMK